MGSGKTTLAKNIARTLGWSYLPISLHATNYLSDLFRDQARWAFNTQVAFLVDKAIQIQRNLHEEVNTILDRSLYEDISIFAEYFYSTGSIDARSYETYRSIANYFLSGLKVPDLMIYCSCSLATAKARIASRGKDFEINYPPGHLEEIAQRYGTWIGGYDIGPVHVVDTEAIDFRREKEFSAVLRDVVRRISPFIQNPQRALPFDGFPYGQDVQDDDLSLGRGRRQHRPETPEYPFAYIAAPFTALATAIPQENGSPVLFESEYPHGAISKGRYRRR